MSRTDGATELVDLPAAGRTFDLAQRVRLSDTSTEGVVRLDALARYIQDVATDDARETMPGEHLAWVVRRAVIDVAAAPVSEEACRLTTWCSGYGGRWAERRTRLVGDAGARCDSAVVWVAIDTTTGAPTRLPDTFHQHYDEACSGRKVTARLHHGDPPPTAKRQPWRFRSADLDRLGHVNNAAYWVAVEETFGDQGRPASFRAEIEYRDAVPPGADLELVTEATADGIEHWLTAGDTVHASMRLIYSPTESI